jgi:hypothetical protein
MSNNNEKLVKDIRRRTRKKYSSVIRCQNMANGVHCQSRITVIPVFAAFKQRGHRYHFGLAESPTSFGNSPRAAARSSNSFISSERTTESALVEEGPAPALRIISFECNLQNSGCAARQW